MNSVQTRTYLIGFAKQVRTGPARPCIATVDRRIADLNHLISYKIRTLRQLECWQLTCQFPTGQSPAWSSSDRRNYDSRESDQQTQGLTENKSSFIRKHYVVISRQSLFASNVVAKLVAMATSLRPPGLGYVFIG